jgi:hypothetical protein
MSSLIRATLLTAAVAACAWAADEVASRTDLRLTVEALPTYEISESVSGAGSSNSYEWKGLPNQVWQVGIEKLWLGERKDWGGAVYGLRVNGATQVSKPSGYAVGDAYFSNTSDEQVEWRRLGLGLVGGWQTGPMAIEGVRLFGELTFFAEAAGIYATLNNSMDGDSSLGYGFEGGVRAALMVAESEWYGGLSVTALAGYAQVELSVMQDTATSTMDMGRSGVGLGVVIGRRF